MQANIRKNEEGDRGALQDVLTRFVQLIPEGQVGGLLLMKLDLHDRIGTSFSRVHTRKFCQGYAKKLRRFLPDGVLIMRLTDRRIAIAIVRGSVTEVIDLASSIVDRVEPRIQLGSEKFTVDVCMGAAIYPTHAEDGDSLLRRSKLALQQAMMNGLRFELYESGSSGFQKALWKFETELKEAIRDGQLEVHYQPKFALDTSTVVGVEALVRWRNQSGDLVPAAEFVPAAERSQAITPLTWLVLDQVADAAEDFSFAPRPFAVSINVPAQVLAEEEFFGRLERTRTKLDAVDVGLVVELTEDTLMQTDTASMSVLQRIRDSGVGLAIDDFGKGYSSLNYLRELPATELKIDRDFVKSIATSEKDRHIVQTAIDLAQAFGMESTAEGVDDPDVVNALIEMKCKVVQGFLLGRPMSLEVLQRWFETNAVERFEKTIEREAITGQLANLGHLDSAS